MKLLLLVFAAASLAWGQMSMSVAQLKEFIRTSVERKHADKLVVKYLKQYKLTERVVDRDLMEIVSYGPGPETTEALKELEETTKNLPLPASALKPVAPPPPMPAPPIADQEKIIAEAREVALEYTKKLPNFICLQVTRRYYDPEGLGMFHLADTVAAKLSYFEQKEDYKVISVNGNLKEVAYDKLGGMTSTGEFGSMLREVFEPETQSEFHFDRWAKLRGRVCLVYSYSVQRQYSRWTIEWREGAQTYRPGYTGSVFIDRDAPVVMRLTFQAEGLPAAFPIQDVHSQLDYDYQQISGQQFLLPASVELQMRDGRILTKNEVNFRNYSKYSAESVIKFDTEAEPTLQEEKDRDTREKAKQPK